MEALRELQKNENKNKTKMKEFLIYIVDDSQEIMDLLEMRIQAEYHDQNTRVAIEKYDNVITAKSAIIKKEPDLFIVDQDINGDMGTDLVQHLRKTLRMFPIFLYSAHLNDSDYVRMITDQMEMEVDNSFCITKKYKKNSTDKILQAIDRLISSKVRLSAK